MHNLRDILQTDYNQSVEALIAYEEFVQDNYFDVLPIFLENSIDVMDMIIKDGETVNYEKFDLIRNKFKKISFECFNELIFAMYDDLIKFNKIP